MTTMIRLCSISFLSLILAACGGTSAVRPDSTQNAPAATKPSPPVTKRGGGYYLDDGPGDNPPANIDSIPDAVPRAEPPLPRANRPYSALGSRYTPMTEYRPYRETGIASWYGKRYHGQKTSSGEIYDMYGMTGAHTILPLPSYVRVTNPENNRSVIVRINDRGPFHSNRLIDLSYAAAYKLRLTDKGSGTVIVEAIDTSKLGSAPPASSAVPAPPPTAPPEQPALIPAPIVGTALPTPDNVPEVTPSTMAVSSPLSSGEYVQVGAFKIETNAEGLKDKLRRNNLAENVSIQSWYNNGTYRVLLGPYNSRPDADRAASQIKQVLGANAIVIRK